MDLYENDVPSSAELRKMHGTDALNATRIVFDEIEKEVCAELNEFGVITEGEGPFGRDVLDFTSLQSEHDTAQRLLSGEDSEISKLEQAGSMPIFDPQNRSWHCIDLENADAVLETAKKEQSDYISSEGNAHRRNYNRIREWVNEHRIEGVPYLRALPDWPVWDVRHEAAGPCLCVREEITPHLTCCAIRLDPLNGKEGSWELYYDDAVPRVEATGKCAHDLVDLIDEAQDYLVENGMRLPDLSERFEHAVADFHAAIESYAAARPEVAEAASRALEDLAEYEARTFDETFGGSLDAAKAKAKLYALAWDEEGKTWSRERRYITAADLEKLSAKEALDVTQQVFYESWQDSFVFVDEMGFPLPADEDEFYNTISKVQLEEWNVAFDYVNGSMSTGAPSVAERLRSEGLAAAFDFVTNSWMVEENPMGLPSETFAAVRSAEELSRALSRYVNGQISGQGNGRCPFDAFATCAGQIEQLAEKAGDAGKHVLDDLAKTTKQWYAAPRATASPAGTRDAERDLTR